MPRPRPWREWTRIAFRVRLCYRKDVPKTARIIEIFSSIQGEGIYVGQPHLFVRFWNCNLSCHYCDTDYRGPYTEWTAQDLLREVRRHLESSGPFHAVSLTGGEPLLWWQFLKEWLPTLKSLGQRTYLETNGTLPDALSEILPWTDIIAMDIKPPSATADRPLWKEHELFLKVACQAGKEIFVKIVVTPDTDSEELTRAFDLVSRIDAQIPVIVQPVTPWGLVKDAPSPEQLNQWVENAGDRLSHVEVIPQVHRLLGVP